MTSSLTPEGSKWLWGFLLALAGMLAYLPSLNGEFVGDDTAVWELQVPSFTSLSSAFAPPQGIPEWEGSYFRPVVVLSYMADRGISDAILGSPGPLREDAMGKSRARIPHASTLLYHGLAIIAVYALARKIFEGMPGEVMASMVAGGAFALHPIHAETVAFISGRSDSLSTAFLAMALYLALIYDQRHNIGEAVGASVFFLLALMAKETALCGVLILAALMWLKKSQNLKILLTGFGVSLCVYLALRLSLAGPIPSALGEGLGDKLINVAGALGFYARKAVFPWPLLPFTPEFPGALHTLVWVGALLCAGFLAWRSYRGGSRFFAFCLAWFLAGVSLPLWVAFQNVLKAPLAERYLYLPSVGLALALGYGATKINKKTAFALCAAVGLAWFATSAKASLDWQTNLKTYSALTRDPVAAGYGTPWVFLGLAHLDANDLDEAEKAFKRAFDPGVKTRISDSAAAKNGLAGVAFVRAERYFNSRDFARSKAELQTAEKMMAGAMGDAGKNWTRLQDLGNVRFLLSQADLPLGGGVDFGLLEEARRDLAESLRLNPANDFVRQRLSHIEAILAQSRRGG